jgi:hypothetical protein
MLILNFANTLEFKFGQVREPLSLQNHSVTPTNVPHASLMSDQCCPLGSARLPLATAVLVIQLALTEPDW